jgi:signal transduction histidine kinase/ligand-binding sensor domain-containing protein/DNA-binding response OmpR family regulator
MRILLIKTLIFLAITFINTTVIASTLHKTYNVASFSSEKNLNIQTVKAVTQDKRGYIWLASDAGLFRFDGNNLKEIPLTTANNPQVIHVRSLLIDSHDVLWVGTEKGVFQYQEQQDSFRYIELKAHLTNSIVLSLLEDNSGSIWIGTRDDGLFKISISKKDAYSIIHFRKSADIRLALSSNDIRSLYQTTDGNIWIGTKNGLNRYNIDSNTISSYQVNLPKDPLLNITIYSILEHEGNLLLGSDKGLLKFNPNTLHSKRYSSDKNLKNAVYKIIASHDNKLIVGSKINGLLIIDPATKVITELNKNHNQSSELNTNMVFDIYSDKLGNIWLGTNVGFKKLTYSTNAIELYRQQNNDSKCIASNENHAIFLDSKENLWIGARGQGLNLINKKNGSCTLFDSKNINLPNISFNLILAIEEDLQGNIWIASYDEGLIKYNPNSQKFSRLHFNDIVKNQLIQQASISDIKIDENNNLWLAMFDHGLVQYNQKDQTLTLHGNDIAKKYQKEKITIRSIEYINKKLWLGTQKLGLLSFDTVTNETQYYPFSTNHNIVTSSLDKKHNIWLGTKDSGVFKFTPKTNKYLHLQSKDGLANDDILDIQVDDNNNVWIGTRSGLSMFNQTTSAFTNYYKKDGLQSNDSSLGSFFDKRTSFLWLGGMNGINRIDTKALNKKADKSFLYLTNLKINGAQIRVHTEKQPSPLKENIISAKTLTLTHRQSNFAFNFANINYQNTDKLSYQYQLAGYDQWTDVSRENLSANYTNIPAGTYQFKVRVTDNNGQRTIDEVSIELIILPPWWLTPIALVSYFLMLLFAIYSVIHFRTRALRDKAVELEYSVFERTRELAEEKEKVVLLLEQKNEEFANLSHEFRTPLTLILGTSSQLLTDELTDKQHSRLEVIKRNGYRLLRMADQLLNIETFRVKAISQKSPQATGIIIKQLVDAFADLAFEKGIKLQVIHIENITCELVQDALEKIVVNLLSNAIKYTPNGGSVTVETKRTANNELSIQIVDTGSGIPEDQLESVFEKYKRVLNKNSEQISGAGIGLALIKELILSHNGKITLTSQLESGTCITVVLPILNEVDYSTTNKAEISIASQLTDNIVEMELMSLTHQPKYSTLLPSTHSSTEAIEQPKILIIEDNQDMNHYMTSCLSEDYLVINAYDGQEGVTLAEQEVPDLIISDVMMSKLDGYQATKKIRENPITNHIPIILLTSRNDLESKIKGWQHQVDEYLTKPFNVEELKIRISNLLAIRNILKNRYNKVSLAGRNIPQDILENATDTSDAELIEKQEIFIGKLDRTLEKRFADTSITVNSIARDIAMSERQLFRKLKSVLGMTPTEYLRRFRLEKACRLLADGNSATNTAFDVGFSSQSYFGRCFKSEYGFPPSDFKKHLRDHANATLPITRKEEVITSEI